MRTVPGAKRSVARDDPLERLFGVSLEELPGAGVLAAGAGAAFQGVRGFQAVVFQDAAWQAEPGAVRCPSALRWP